jgi:hypothetical protein
MAGRISTGLVIYGYDEEENPKIFTMPDFGANKWYQQPYIGNFWINDLKGDPDTGMVAILEMQHGPAYNSDFALGVWRIL